MPVVGTAGHVDHGKSTLIQRISGRNPDRWEEERNRGLTIDLGFAWTRLPDGTEVSFVDVPGHEKFLKNMLAGIEAIDATLLVVAADEGWMPQSEEHLAVLTLLEVDSGVVALTKVDAVDEELRELALSEVSEHLEGTTLEGASIVPVSSVSGEGIDDLLRELGECLGDPLDRERPRLWVDRSFPVSGAGTVVTGTLLDGHFSLEDSVEILPAGLQARIRGIQSHEESHDSVGPGRRVALNLGGVDHSDIRRGDMVAVPGQWLLSGRFAGSLQTARYVDSVDLRGAYQAHIGSASVGARLTGSEDGGVVIELADELPLSVGDRFILRDTGRRMVVAGGRVLDPSPGPTRKALRLVVAVDPEASNDAIATTLLEIRGIDRLDSLSAHSGGGIPQSDVAAGGTAVSATRLVELRTTAEQMVDAEHHDHPLRNGLALATLVERLGLPAELVEAIVTEGEGLIRSGPDVARPDHTASLTDAQEIAWETARDRLAADLAVPGQSDLGLEPDVVGLKLRAGELVRIDYDLLYLPQQIDELKNVMQQLTDDFTVADFRDAAGLSRKYAVPILEWSDREGLTVRRGDRRSLR